MSSYNDCNHARVYSMLWQPHVIYYLSAGVYYCFNMVIIVLAIILSSLVVNIARGSYDRRTRAPLWMHVVSIDWYRLIYQPTALLLLIMTSDRVVSNFQLFIRCIGRAMRLKAVRNLESILRPRQFSHGDRSCRNCIDCLPLVQKSAHSTEDAECACQNHTDSSPEGATTNTTTDVTYDHIYRSTSMTGKELCSDLTVPILRQLQFDVKEVKSVIKNMWQILYLRENRELDEQAVEVEWQTIALVLDRLFFFLYVSLIAFSLVFFFPQPT